MKTLSICVPTFNDLVELERTLKSLDSLSNSETSFLEDLEVLVSDNASTDATQIALANWDVQGVSVRKFVQTSNLGFRNNLEFLARNSSAKWVMYMFSGDSLGSDYRLSDLLPLLGSARENTVFFDFNLFDETTNSNIGQSPTDLFEYKVQTDLLFGTAPLPIFRRSSLVDAMGSCPNISGEWWPQVEWALTCNRETGTAGQLGMKLISANRPKAGWWVRRQAYQSVLELARVLNTYSRDYKLKESLLAQSKLTYRTLPAWVFQTKVVHKNRLDWTDIRILARDFKRSPMSIAISILIVLCPVVILSGVREFRNKTLV